MTKYFTRANRDSSIELFRIVTMLCIVAHHYIVNSGILQEITQANVMNLNSVFALLFGWGGKTGINCFVLITGYFMCKSDISLKKFLKLYLQIIFYNILFLCIFSFTGYSHFSVKELVKAFLPVYGLGTGFTSSYLVFFLFIPYLNILVNAMSEKQHRYLILLSFIVSSALQTFLMVSSAFTYVGWFMVLYVIASYIRIYTNKIFNNKKLWGFIALGMLLLSWLSVIIGAFVYHKTGKVFYFYFVSNSNKVLALLTAVSAFLFFKNLNLKNSMIINGIAASTFGVLLIHANSDNMRQWLWNDLLNNVGAYHSDYFMVHAVISVITVYVVCTLIDMVRIALLEKTFFRRYDSLIGNIKAKFSK